MWNNNVDQTCKDSSTILYIYFFYIFMNGVFLMNIKQQFTSSISVSSYFPNSYLKFQMTYMIIFSGHILFNTLFATLEKNGTQNMVYQASVYSHILDVKFNP